MAGKTKSIIDDEFLDQNLNIVKCFIVFMDIVKYSKRNPIFQFTVLGKFNLDINSTFEGLYNEFNDHLSPDGINIMIDPITLPTGDGMAIIFPFQNNLNLHLRFAEIFLDHIEKENAKSKCDLFLKEGYCLEHNHYKVRIGIGVGDCILYNDINKNINLVGNEINLAARAMGLAGHNQIVFTEEAYKNQKDLNHGFQNNHFTQYTNVKIKHDDCINIYHYVKPHYGGSPLKLEYCDNSKLPKQIEIFNSSTNRSIKSPSFRWEVAPLLEAASKDPIGQILFLVFMNGSFVVQSNGIKFNQSNDVQEKVAWLSLIEILIKEELIMPKIPGAKGSYLITGKGLEYLKSEV